MNIRALSGLAALLLMVVPGAGGAESTMAEPGAASAVTATAGRASAFAALSPGDRRVVRALYRAQVGRAGRRWPLDRIAAQRRGGAPWGRIFKRMKAEGLIREPYLARVVEKFGQKRGRAVAAPGAEASAAVRTARATASRRARPRVRFGAYKALSPGDRRIADALFEAQRIVEGSAPAWSLDRIATARAGGAPWREIFRRLRNDRLIGQRTLRLVVRRARPVGAAVQQSAAQVFVTNATGRRVIVHAEGDREIGAGRRD